MSEETWGESPSGILMPPPKPNRRPRIYEEYPAELVEAVRGEFDGIISNLQESIQGGLGNADALGVAAYNREYEFGEGFLGRQGPQEEVLRLLSERLTHISTRLYGGVYGFGYGGVTEAELGDILRQMSALMWVFPEYNPMIKQLVSIRPNYVFAQGFDIVGESKKRKKQKMKLIQERRAEMQLQRQQQMQMMADQAAQGGQPGQGGGNSGPGYSAGSMGRDSMMQRNGASGRVPSTPGARAGRQNPCRESLEEADPAQSNMASTELSHTPEEESDQARVVREFWEDPCTRERFSSVRSLQRVDMQGEVEGNYFVVLRSKGLNQMPEISVWPTHSMQSIVMDDLEESSGIELGYVVQPPNQNQIAVTGSGRQSREVYPAMVADDVPRLKQVLAKNSSFAWHIDETVRVYHYKEWGPVWRGFGLPSILSALIPASRYTSYTAEWSIIQRVLATYTMLVTGYGNNKGLSQIGANYAERISNRFGANSLSDAPGVGANRTPPVGMAAITGMSPTGLQGTQIQPIRTAGSTDPPQMSREFKLQAEMSMGYPDNMFSDTSVGTMSRADVLERHTHLSFLTQQQEYTQIFTVISKCVVKMQLGEKAQEDTDIIVSWPPIVMPAKMEQAGTLIQLYQADGIPKKILVDEALKLLNRADRHEVMQMLFPTDEDGMELKSDSDLDMLGQAQTGQPGQPVEPSDPMAALESMLESSRYYGDLTLHG